MDYLLDLDADYHTLMDDNINNQTSEITVGTYFRTIKTSSKRIWLIDTPGVNSSQNIIEPAKGEYKNVFGNSPDVRVLGTNPQFTDLT